MTDNVEVPISNAADAFSREINPSQRSAPRLTSLPPRKTNTRSGIGMENSTRELIQSDTDLTPVQAPQPAATARNGNSPLLTPSNRGFPMPTAEGSPALPKSLSTSRMAFMRRPKRTESTSTKMRKIALQDQDDDVRANTEDPGHSFLYDNAFGKVQSPEGANGTLPKSGSEAGRSAPPPPPVPEGNLKKKVTRIERSIAEQTAWVRQKFDLDQSDVLRESCSAALVQKIMLQGRLHITDTCMCFYAKIFGIVTKEKWSFSTIANVRKRRGGFVANSIKITFLNPDTPPVIIASLNRRESTLAIIHSRLTLMNPGGERGCLGGSMGEDSEEQSADDYHSRPGGDAHRSDRSNSSNQMSSDHHLRPSFDGAPGHVYGQTGHESTTSEESPHGRGRTEKKQPGANSAPNAALDALVWVSSGDPMDKVHGTDFAKKTEQARGTFDVPPVFVFNELFVSNWLETFNTDTGNLDVELTSWRRGDDGVMVREAAFRHPLAYRIGPKETRVKEDQRYSFTSDGGVLVEIAVNNIDALYGDYFVVEMYFELKPANNGRWCEMISYVAVHFMKSTMMRSKIESGALAETKITHAKMIESGRNHVNTNVSKELVSAYLSKSEGSRKKANGTRAPRPPVRKHAKEAKKSKTTVESNVRESESAAVGLAPAGQMMSAPQASPTIIQVQDTTTSQLLRVVAIAGLIMVCILLVLVLLSFRRMKHEFQVLQTIVREMQAGSAMRSTGNAACGA